MSLKDILHPKTSAGTLIRDIIVILLIVAVIGIVLFAVAGTWPAMVAVESGSMEPNITTYSLVFVVDENRFGGWQTQKEALASGAGTIFNGYGDVIVYQPNGITGVTPIIHRAITTITAEEAATDWNFTGDAAHAGVITKGDNPITNSAPDQAGYFARYGRMQPVKPEWIVGKAVFAIPFIGWIPLNIIPSILIAIGIVVVIEIISHIVAKRKAASSANRRDKRNNTNKTKKQ
ncbi:MAG TPA: S26 family signal peptidase [Methanocorpusculum sp.]|nr:S26 family signal peptidase [Methanocorpusculum sp.]